MTETSIHDYACNECHVGLLKMRHVTYFTRLGDELITVQNFPAWICDVCGKREYDQHSIHWLDMMLDPNAGKPTKSKRRTTPLPKPQYGFLRPTLDS